MELCNVGILGAKYELPRADPTQPDPGVNPTDFYVSNSQAGNLYMYKLTQKAGYEGGSPVMQIR